MTTIAAVDAPANVLADERVTIVCLEARRKELKPIVIDEEIKQAGVEIYLEPPK